jgi:hypothetical protein
MPRVAASGGGEHMIAPRASPAIVEEARRQLTTPSSSPRHRSSIELPRNLLDAIARGSQI